MTTAVALLRNQYKESLGWLQGTMDGMTPEVFSHVPGERVAPISAQLAHIITGADFFVLGQAALQQPLMLGDFAGKSGISEPPPQGDWSEWAQRVEVDGDQVHEYATAVFAAIDHYLAGLSDDDLDQTRDLGPIGQQSVAWILNIILLNTYSHTGEIACIKGLQGLKGYPM